MRSGAPARSAVGVRLRARGGLQEASAQARGGEPPGRRRLDYEQAEVDRGCARRGRLPPHRARPLRAARRLRWRWRRTGARCGATSRANTTDRSDVLPAFGASGDWAAAAGLRPDEVILNLYLGASGRTHFFQSAVVPCRTCSAGTPQPRSRPPSMQPSHLRHSSAATVTRSRSCGRDGGCSGSRPRPFAYGRQSRHCGEALRRSG